MVAIAARGLTKIFDDVVAVDDVDLEIKPGEFLVVLGPTGCGKSTLLRLLAGFEEPTSGTVTFDGVPVAEIEPRERDIAVVFQNYALYPHLTVAQNIGFPLRATAAPAADIGARVAAVARNVGIADLLSRYPEHLSGGQRQRVAMARALVRQPAVFLLDEPLSNVDAGARAALRGEIVALARRLAVTTIYVTHDQTEAMSMADRIAVLRLGVLQQVGPPVDVYADPDTLFVAAFLGMPRTSLLEAAVYAQDGGVVLDLGSQVLELPPGDPRTARLAEHHTERVTLVLRALPLQERDMSVRGTVCAVENLGHELLAHVDVGGVPSVRLDAPVAPSRAVAQSTPYGFYPAYDLVDAPPTGEVMVRIPVPVQVRIGDDLDVGVGLTDLLLFDRAGRRIRFDPV
ncbi:ABC transporter ATP-binding protein [Actinoplanes auranticolor]|uniref:Sugar ABC transporter ATP-binding protein n=1 Tax=Actinoplanes auranticolor TaxID=47988 RepID=A0A919SHK7_9ACTN|nr:ABC transporter ATP-binding protein [Actinoplanes auranticolor]GIM72577.1 sugar ABC transporter ATP-binding protein [Actinoplanes auranticolor]